MTLLEEAVQRAVWRDEELTTAEKLAVVTDPWWQTVPRVERTAWWLRWARQRWAHGAGHPSWEVYLAALENERLLSLTAGAHDRPETEHQVTEPWPEGFPVPAAVAKLQAVADPSWEVRVGYARGFRKVGRGNVGTSASARWELTHSVLLCARPVGDRGRAWVQVAYVAPAVPGKLAWKHDHSAVPGSWKAAAAAAKEVLSAPASEAADRLSATRQKEAETVAATTDIFALWTSTAQPPQQ